MERIKYGVGGIRPGILKILICLNSVFLLLPLIAKPSKLFHYVPLYHLHLILLIFFLAACIGFFWKKSWALKWIRTISVCTIAMYWAALMDLTSMILSIQSMGSSSIPASDINSPVVEGTGSHLFDFSNVPDSLKILAIGLLVIIFTNAIIIKLSNDLFREDLSNVNNSSHLKLFLWAGITLVILGYISKSSLLMDNYKFIVTGSYLLLFGGICLLGTALFCKVEFLPMSSIIFSSILILFCHAVTTWGTSIILWIPPVVLGLISIYSKRNYLTWLAALFSFSNMILAILIMTDLLQIYGSMKFY
jgi:hypothetical protein